MTATPANAAPVNINDTSIAFAHKSDFDLKRAWALFVTLSDPRFVKLGKWASSLALGMRLPITPLVRWTLFKQFVGGESIEACEATIRELAKRGVGAILDYSVEAKSREEDFDNTTRELLRVLDRAAADVDIPFAVFKVSGLGSHKLLVKASNWGNFSPEEQAARDRIYDRIDRICAHAVEVQTPVFIDAEESWIQPIIDHWALEMMRKYNKDKAWVWNTAQLYRRSCLREMGDVIALARDENWYVGFKLVRGAYLEKENERALHKGVQSPIQPTKAATDLAFDQGVELCLENLERVSFCAGSHNEKSTIKLTEAMKTRGIAAEDPRIWFAQLLGMSDHLSFNLAHKGYNVVKYVPYGPVKELIPYLIRRAEENTSVQGQTGRELGLLVQEMRRRQLL